MSFNINDPLAGILSDGSDDSFFDDDILGKKKPPKNKNTPTAEKKNSLFDLDDKTAAGSLTRKDALFDLDSKKSPATSKRTDTTKEPVQLSHSVSKMKTDINKLGTAKSPAKAKISASADTIDILGDLIDPKKESYKSIEKGKSSQSLLDDILGESSAKKSVSNQVVRAGTTSKSQDLDIHSIIPKVDAKTAGLNLPQTQSRKEKEVKEKTETVGKKNKSSQDWLGIFQEEEKGTDFEDDSAMPSWLVGDKKKKEETKEIPKKEPVKEQTKDESQIQSEEKQHVLAKTELEPTLPNLNNFAKSIPSNVFQEVNGDITAEGAALYLQQQESQIMVALQMKAQEEKLAAMQMRQKESLRVQRESAQAQQSQLDAMLRRQAENRQQMQSIIAAHQERITERIKALLGTDNTDNQEVTYQTGDLESGERRETPHARERQQLLQLVQSLQENHDKEIDLMETSYRRQLAFLEVSLSQTEERMKEESDKLVKYYTEKMNWLEEHHHIYRKMTENNLDALSERHKSETELLRQQHLENIKALQEHHASLMENIKNAVKHEQMLIQDSASFSADLKELVSDVRANKHHSEELIEKVQALVENAERKTDGSLQVREIQINEMIQQLKKERENFDIEKSENRETIKMLEARLKQMTTIIEEESVALKQKRMEFEFEKATFNKQTEFAKNILKKQDEEIKALREEIQKEYQERTAKIQEEKTRVIQESAALGRDKSAVQNLKQELEKMKAELEAQLEEATKERSRLKLESQQLYAEEQRIIAKGRDLDLLAKTAIDKQAEAERKYSEAEFVQKKYEDRIRRIQENVVSLNAREKQIAKEKVMLSRERLTLHNEKKKVESRQQCSLCKSSQYPTAFYEPNYNMPEPYANVSATREFGTDVDSAMNAIEMEMAHLMGRNLNLRYSAGVGDLRRHDDEDSNTFRQIGQEPPDQGGSGGYKDYMDPKFMMLRLDVQKVLKNLEHNKKEDFLPADNVGEQNR